MHACIWMHGLIWSDKGFLPHPERLLYCLASLLSTSSAFTHEIIFQTSAQYKPMLPAGHLLLPQRTPSSFAIWHKERERDWLKNGSCLFDTLTLRTDGQRRLNNDPSRYLTKCHERGVCMSINVSAAVRKQPVLEQNSPSLAVHWTWPCCRGAHTLLLAPEAFPFLPLLWASLITLNGSPRLHRVY